MTEPMDLPELVVEIAASDADAPEPGLAVMEVTPGRAVLLDGTQVAVVNNTPTLEELEAQGRIIIKRQAP
ncbi:MAG TPA: hypothetical protein VFY14_16875 [Streptomyces sp.]|nr:hypothetical protein [Streptomyces sp.]